MTHDFFHIFALNNQHLVCVDFSQWDIGRRRLRSNNNLWTKGDFFRKNELPYAQTPIQSISKRPYLLLEKMQIRLAVLSKTPYLEPLQHTLYFDLRAIEPQRETNFGRQISSFVV